MNTDVSIGDRPGTETTCEIERQKGAVAQVGQDDQDSMVRVIRPGPLQV